MIKKRESLLSVRSLSVSFQMYIKGVRHKESPVIRNLSIDVAPGEIVAVAGASGSGKSVLAHSILGLLPENARTQGDIVYDGTLLCQKEKERLRGNEIVLIPQSVNYLDPLMKVADQILMPRKGDGGRACRREQAGQLIARYGLEKKVLDYYPFQLSGGMARRVLVSAAASCGARLVIADEPTPGMDEAAIAETVRLFRGLAKKGCGVMLITHDIEMALQAADRVAVFLEGTVVETAHITAFDGNGEQLKHPFSKALAQARPANGFTGSRKEEK